jgi:hypothetical protein
MRFDFAGHLLVRVSTTVAIFSLLVCGAPQIPGLVRTSTSATRIRTVVPLCGAVKDARLVA